MLKVSGTETTPPSVMTFTDLSERLDYHEVRLKGGHVPTYEISVIPPDTTARPATSTATVRFKRNIILEYLNPAKQVTREEQRLLDDDSLLAFYVELKATSENWPRCKKVDEEGGFAAIAQAALHAATHNKVVSEASQQRRMREVRKARENYLDFDLTRSSGAKGRTVTTTYSCSYPGHELPFSYTIPYSIPNDPASG
jgi:hypothetical protein